MAALALLAAAPALAGPVICTTTLEAPLAGSGNSSRLPSAPVEVSRCEVVQSTPQLMGERAHTWRSSFARGVSLSHQITDMLGIAMGGRDGNRVMGLGFPEQAIIWDASAIGTTTRALLEQQSLPMPQRTADLPSLFSSSLNGAPMPLPVQAAQPTGHDWPVARPNQEAPVRGLW
jgi:hypothetical protein